MAERESFQDFKNAFLSILTETFEGPQAFAAYLDKDAGILPTLKNVDYKLASMSVFPHQPSVVAHANHSKIHLAGINSLIRGKPQRIDWPKTWELKTVNQKEWLNIQNELKDEYAAIKNSFNEDIFWDEKNIAVLMAGLAHLAYHLAAMRQILTMLQAQNNS